jgi:hypothetical protein
MDEMLTPEQRLDRAERILIATIKSGRRTRSEWRFKINSLIDAQMRDEAEWRVRTAKIDEQLREVAVAQAENAKAIAELRESQAELKESQKLTDKALRTYIESLRKNRNGNSD